MDAARIQAAIEAGEVLRVRYFGGSTPGAERALLPLILTGDQVRARCMHTGVAKTFALAKIEEVLPGTPSQLATAMPPAPAVFPTIAEFVAHHGATFERGGWVAEQTEHSLSLHSRAKNGRVYKGSDLALSFEPVAFDTVLNGDGTLTETNHRPRQRPWCVSGKTQRTRAFGDLAKAQAAFLELLAELVAQRDQQG